MAARPSSPGEAIETRGFGGPPRSSPAGEPLAARYLLTCWYMAAWSDEVSGAAMLSRTLLDQPILLFRDERGEAVALLDRCPHRFAPLSMGVLQNGRVSCGYHGLTFGRDGGCVANPHGPITGAMTVRAYPVHEAHRALWIWMGPPEDADPALIPDLGYLAACPETAFSKGHLASFGHYQLFVDNILDLSHTDYLHPTTLGGGGLTRATSTVERNGDEVTVRWWSPNDRASPLLDTLLPEPGRPADIWAEVCWRPPGVMTLTNGATPAGESRAAGVEARNAHVLTPETGTSTHYFFAATRDFRVEDVELNARIAERRAWIFTHEDKPMIEAQQRRIGDAAFWSLKPVLMKTDQAPVLVRRLMDSLIAAQTQKDLSP